MWQDCHLPLLWGFNLGVILLHYYEFFSSHIQADVKLVALSLSTSTHLLLDGCDHLLLRREYCKLLPCQSYSDYIPYSEGFCTVPCWRVGEVSDKRTSKMWIGAAVIHLFVECHCCMQAMEGGYRGLLSTSLKMAPLCHLGCLFKKDELGDKHRVYGEQRKKP